MLAVPTYARLFRKTPTVALAILLTLLLAPATGRAVPRTLTWTPSPPDNHDWTASGNWSPPPGPPAPGDTVIIPAGAWVQLPNFINVGKLIVLADDINRTTLVGAADSTRIYATDSIRVSQGGILKGADAVNVGARGGNFTLAIADTAKRGAVVNDGVMLGGIPRGGVSMGGSLIVTGPSVVFGPNSQVIGGDGSGGGKGGAVTVSATRDSLVNQGIERGGNADPAAPGDGGDVTNLATRGQVRPGQKLGGHCGNGGWTGKVTTMATRLLAGATDRVTGHSIYLRGTGSGADTVKLAGLAHTLVQADSGVVIDLCGNSVIDLRGNPPGIPVIAAGVSILLRGRVLTDPGVSVASLTSPPAIVSDPACPTLLPVTYLASASLGTLSVNGPVTFDTDPVSGGSPYGSGRVVTIGANVVSGGMPVRVFDFNDVTIGGGAVIHATGSGPLVITSGNSIGLLGTIDVSGSSGHSSTRGGGGGGGGGAVALFATGGITFTGQLIARGGDAGAGGASSGDGAGGTAGVGGGSGGDGGQIVHGGSGGNGGNARIGGGGGGGGGGAYGGPPGAAGASGLLVANAAAGVAGSAGSCPTAVDGGAGGIGGAGGGAAGAAGVADGGDGGDGGDGHLLVRGGGGGGGGAVNGGMGGWGGDGAALGGGGGGGGGGDDCHHYYGGIGAGAGSGGGGGNPGTAGGDGTGATASAPMSGGAGGGGAIFLGSTYADVYVHGLVDLSGGASGPYSGGGAGALVLYGRADAPLASATRPHVQDYVEFVTTGAATDDWTISGGGGGGGGGAPGESPGTTAVGDASIPQHLELAAITPNPVANRAVIRFGLPRTGSADLGVFDLAGRRVMNLALATRTPGWHELTWDCRLADGRRAAPGVYFVRLFADNEARKRTLVIR